MKILHRHAAPPSTRAPAEQDVLPATTGRKRNDFFAREHLRAMPRKLLHPNEDKNHAKLMSAGGGAATGGAICLGVICAPFIFVANLVTLIVCCPCITAAACCADDSLVMADKPRRA